MIDLTPLPWVADALCAQTDPDAFFPDKGGPIKDAKKICGGCPVREECLEAGITGVEVGIWGGTTERDRQRIRAQRAAAAAGGVAA
ncbi:WhiB family transcriptional regulator [Brachybacterium sp. DNPG3]